MTRLVLTPRQRFWLTAVLAVTFPVWFLPFVACVILLMFGLLLWEAAEDVAGLIAPDPSRPKRPSRMGRL